MEEDWCGEVTILFILMVTILILNAIHIKVETRSLWIAIQFALLFPVIMTIVAIMFTLYPFFVIYRAYLSVKLRRMYGEKFYGLLHGLDAPLSHPNTKYGMIGGLVIVEIDTNLVKKTVLQYVQDFVDVNILNNEHFSKLRTTAKWYGGYPYWEKIDVKSEDCVRTLPTVEDTFDDVALSKLLGRSHYIPFKGPLMWDVMVGTQPLKRNADTKPNIKQYPIMIRVYHGLADGVTIIQLLAGVFNDKVSTDIKKIGKLPEAEDYIVARLFQFIGKVACVMVYFPSVLYSLTLLKTDFNELHNRGIEDDENIAFQFDENGTYFQKVKNIKNQTGATIPEIICTVYNESLKEHFQKYKKKRGDHLSFLLPIVRNYEEIERMKGINIKNLTLSNKIALTTLAIPSSIENEDYFDPSMPYYSKLMVVRKRAGSLKRSVEFQVSVILYHLIIQMFPSIFSYYFTYIANTTSIVSLIPGLPELSYCNGTLIVKEAAFWVPHLLEIDLALGSFSYNNRLIISLNCDSLCMSHEMAQEILQNVYKNIDLFEKELHSLHI